MRLLQQLRRSLARSDLLPPGCRVIVALSGGSDSVALAHLLVDLARHGEFTVSGLAHLNHQLRPTAGRDEEACRHVAADLGLPLAVERVDVRGYAASERLSLEDAARRLRYDFLERAASRMGADRIAVGHTQDDQAETFLLKLIRGAGPAGLAGIYPRRGMVVRPVLGASRAELRAYLQERGIAWVDDETNADLSNPRNRIRHVVLPELERAAGGAVRPSIARAADLIRDDDSLLQQLAETAYRRHVRGEAGSVAFDAAGLAAEPLPVVRRVLLMALRRIAGGREAGLEHVLGAAQVLAGARAGIDVPGGRVELRREKLVLLKQGSSVSDTLNES